MTFAPRFAPDGNKLIMSLAQDGQTDIFEMDLRTQSMERLTRSPSIDTSPSYSPEGNAIVFNSDRGGTQQLYIMDSTGQKCDPYQLWRWALRNACLVTTW